MTPRRAITTISLLACAVAVSPSAATAVTPWHITGKLSESCTCSVPCTCNFGQSPSPHAFCWALVGLHIDKGSYGDVDLGGVQVAGGQGAKGFVFYIDPTATDAQAAAMKEIATQMWLKALKANGVKDPKHVPDGFQLLGFRRAHIEQTVGDRGNHVLIANAGRFDADYIMGIDGKTPVRIENNWTFNITNNIKGKSRVLRYHDSYGNAFSNKDTNVNQGDFDWSDATPVYFR